MADLKKLDEVVDQLGVQSQKLMKFSEIYTEISKIKDDLEANNNAFASISEKLDKSTEVLNKETKKLSAKLTEIQGEIMQRIDLIEEANKKFQRDLDSDMTSKLSKHQSDFEVTIRAEAKETANSIENSLTKLFPEQLNEMKTTMFKVADENDKLTKKVDLLSLGVIAIVAILVYQFFLKV